MILGAPVVERAQSLAIWGSLLLMVAGNVIIWTKRSGEPSRTLVRSTLAATVLFVLNILFLPSIQVA
jgi:hypothetical protein